MYTLNGKPFSDSGNSDFVKIRTSKNNNIRIELYKNSKLIGKEIINPESEGIKKLVSKYFPTNDAELTEYCKKVILAKVNGTKLPIPPLDANNIDYEWPEEIDYIIKNNFDDFPD